MTPIENISLLFVTLIGACVGSFLNVVIYRLPAGQSIVHPPSRCPHCGHKLTWHENIPVLSWLVLRARCRQCKTPISCQYPLVEAFTALLFGGLFYLLYATNIRPDFAGPGLSATWPIYGALVFLFAAAFACVVIDARHFIIPVRAMWLAAGVGAVALIATAQWLPGSIATVELPHTSQAPIDRLAAVEPAVYQNSAAVRLAVLTYDEGSVTVTALPRVTGGWLVAAAFALIGLVIANLLLATGLLPRSFDQPADESDGEQEDGPDAWLAHPHPRREVGKELLFLALPVALAALGHQVFGRWGESLPPSAEVAGGVVVGLLIGGAVVWATRILGTLGFGKEAMGLGDVHLMAAIGTVAGWRVAVIAFFVAPFFGLAYALLSFGTARVLRREVRVIPYGPHLALASVVVIVLREPLVARLAIIFG